VKPEDLDRLVATGPGVPGSRLLAGFSVPSYSSLFVLRRRVCGVIGGFARSIAQCLGADVHQSLFGLMSCLIFGVTSSAGRSSSRSTPSILRAWACIRLRCRYCSQDRSRSSLRVGLVLGWSPRPWHCSDRRQSADVDAMGGPLSYRLRMERCRKAATNSACSGRHHRSVPMIGGGPLSATEPLRPPKRFSEIRCRKLRAARFCSASDLARPGAVATCRTTKSDKTSTRSRPSRRSHCFHGTLADPAADEPNYMGYMMAMMPVALLVMLSFSWLSLFPSGSGGRKAPLGTGAYGPAPC